MEQIEFARVKTNGITLNVAQAGAAGQPLMILLHGFPECSYGWKKHIPILANADKGVGSLFCGGGAVRSDESRDSRKKDSRPLYPGFRVWAPDQRGYNTSDKPTSIADYALDKLAADVIGLIDAAGCQRAILVGHDWGAAVAWWVAHNFPQRVDKLVIINVPHPLVMRRLLKSSIRQLMRSWYIFAIQIPWLPEWGGRLNQWRSVVQAMQKSSLPDTFSAADFDEYRRAWSQPGAYTSMLNWYRAIFRHGSRRPQHQRITTPTLILWGRRDKFIGPEGAELSLELCDHADLVMFPENTHWLQHERPQEICQRIVEFASEQGTQGTRIC